MAEVTDFHSGKPYATLDDVLNEAEMLNGFGFETLINWNWIFFNSDRAAKDFVDYLDSIGWEHRGVYNPSTTNPKLAQGYGVRFRK